jgi:hypothetical protein
MCKKCTILIIAGIIISTGFNGCSWFESSRKINMNPFSENAGTLFGEAAKIGRPFKWKRLKRYTTVPEFQRATSEARPIIENLNGIVYYSNQVVAINNSNLSEKEKNQQLTRYLGDVLKKAYVEGRMDSLGMDLETLKQILDDIPKQETYLDGIATASPIINRVVVSMQERLDRIQIIVAEIIVVFDHLIDTEFAMTRTNYISLKRLQARTLRAMTMIYDGIMGEPVQPDSLFKLDLSLHRFFPENERNVTIAQLTAAENYLLERLNRIDHMIIQMDDDIQEYHAKQDEKEAWRISVDEKIKMARNAMTVWAQSHRNLGAGIPVPPLIDVAGIAGGLVGTATSAVLP